MSESSCRGSHSRQYRGFAYVEPSHRQLRMPATIKSNPDLAAERSLTTEIGLDFQTENLSLHTNLYWTQNLGVISIDENNTLQNLYDSEVLGLDLGVVGMLPPRSTEKSEVLGLCIVYTLDDPRALKPRVPPAKSSAAGLTLPIPSMALNDAIEIVLLGTSHR